MTDKEKLDKLVSEIERRIGVINKRENKIPADRVSLIHLKELLSFIDSMQKEAKKDAAVKVEQIMEEVDAKFQKFAKECKATQVDTTISDITENHFDEMLGEESGNADLTDRERLEIMIVTTISGLDATYEHYKSKYPVGTHGHVVCSRIPAVKSLVKTYLIEINKEIQIETLQKEIKEL